MYRQEVRRPAAVNPEVSMSTSTIAVPMADGPRNGMVWRTSRERPDPCISFKSDTTGYRYEYALAVLSKDHPEFGHQYAYIYLQAFPPVGVDLGLAYEEAI